MYPMKLLRSSCCSLHSRSLHLRPRSIFSSSKKRAGPPYSHIVQLGDPVLRAKCDPVEAGDIKDREIQEVINTMKFVINRFDCVGLSAPQIGVPLQIMMCQFTNKQIKFWSEEIQKKRGMEVSYSESCSSMLGFSALVPRYSKVEISALDEVGDEVSWSPSGWSARIAQHEFDHLQGKMFIDSALLDSLSFDYWKVVNNRQGDFRLPYDGIKPGITKFMAGFFRQK